MKKIQYSTIDFFRILFTFGVVTGHTYCNLYRTQYMMTHTAELISWHNMCVDGFFVAAGIFLAQYCEKRKESEPYSLFKQYQIARLKRLWMPTMFASVCVFSVNIFQHHFGSFADFVNCWPALFMIGNINHIPGANNGYWYISVLFTVSFLISALLIFKKNQSKYILFPILIAGSFTYMFAVYGNLNLGNNPVMADFFSAGNLRGICGVTIGVEIFYLANYLGNIIRVETAAQKTVIALCEILATLGILYCFTRGGSYRTDFIIYPCWSLLCLIFLMRKEVVYSFCNCAWIKRAIGWFSKYTFMIYLVHFILLENVLRNTDITQHFGTLTVYAIALVGSCVFGIIMYYFEKVFEKVLYSFDRMMVIEKSEM